MSDFNNIIADGLVEALSQTQTDFEFRGKIFQGIFSPQGESAILDGGGFDAQQSASICIPFTQLIGSKPKHDEIITVAGMRYAVTLATVNEASWDCELSQA